MKDFYYSLSDVEYMMPWEREVYLMMLMEDFKKAREEAQKQQMYR